MPVTPAEMLASAAELAGRTDGQEVKARTAVSRIYYAAFHDCQIWHGALPEPGRVTPEVRNQGTHVAFATQLLNPGSSLTEPEKTASRARGIALRRLHGDRVDADYKLRKIVSATDARSALAVARKIVATTVPPQTPTPPMSAPIA